VNWQYCQLLEFSGWFFVHPRDFAFVAILRRGKL